MHVDETGFQRDNQRTTTWVKTTLLLAVLAVGKSRSRNAFHRFVGWSFRGMITTDRYVVYDVVEAHLRQLCWAHILRAFKALVDEGGEAGRIGGKLLKTSRRVIGAYNKWRAGHLKREVFERVMRRCRVVLEKRLGRNMELPGLRTLAHAFILTPASLWLFSTPEAVALGIGPTNNMAERDLRRFVLWKKRSFFTQSRRGDHFMERTSTIVMSCRKQGRSFFAFIADAVAAKLSGGVGPSLLPAPGA